MALEAYLNERLLEKAGHTPTVCQRELFSTLSAFIADSDADNWLMLVTGYAGTGKTTALSSLVSLLKELNRRYILMAPTGRAAKVLRSYAGVSAKTIHKQIYRQKSLQEIEGEFSIDINKFTDTVFIVDEASLINNASAGISIFGSGNLLEDLIKYVRSNRGNKLILMGDPAQLPPVGMECSPALDRDYLSRYCNRLYFSHLTSVVRQRKSSGILHNATLLRNEIERGDTSPFSLSVKDFDDVERTSGAEMTESLSWAIDKYGLDEVVVLCRSNIRANRYNEGIRGRVLFREERLAKGDKLMVVKNCYHFAEQNPDLDFIANGDMCILEHIGNYEELYGFNFATARLSFPDYDNTQIVAKIITDTLTSTEAALSREQQRLLYENVAEDYSEIRTKKERLRAIREDKYYNALQIKYATAITCHKSQGGQWKCVFIDNPFWKEELTIDDKKWLYTAITRGVERVFFVNFRDGFFTDK